MTTEGHVGLDATRPILLCACIARALDMALGIVMIMVPQQGGKGANI